MDTHLKKVKTTQLEVAYEESGDSEDWPCVLLHGFPYDIQCYAECIEPLVKHGARVFLPYLRGYGSTRFLSDKTLRSGEQAALANDLIEMMDALSIDKAVLAGYDWGGRAACIVAALWPERVEALVTGGSYNIQNIPQAMSPISAEEEAKLWYQYYFHSDRGRIGLEVSRKDIARYLWRTWSPSWKFTDEEFIKSAASLDNSDFVDVVIHSYRHRYGLVDGDPVVSHLEKRLEAQPIITVATICVDGSDNGLMALTTKHSNKFSGSYEHRVFEGAGHNLPQEKPAEWVRAILDARNLPA